MSTAIILINITLYFIFFAKMNWTSLKFYQIDRLKTNGFQIFHWFFKFIVYLRLIVFLMSPQFQRILCIYPHLHILCSFYLSFRLNFKKAFQSVHHVVYVLCYNNKSVSNRSLQKEKQIFLRRVSVVYHLRYFSSYHWKCNACQSKTFL